MTAPRLNDPHWDELMRRLRARYPSQGTVTLGKPEAVGYYASPELARQVDPIQVGLRLGQRQDQTPAIQRSREALAAQGTSLPSALGNVVANNLVDVVMPGDYSQFDAQAMDKYTGPRTNAVNNLFGLAAAGGAVGGNLGLNAAIPNVGTLEAGMTAKQIGTALLKGGAVEGLTGGALAYGDAVGQGMSSGEAFRHALPQVGIQAGLGMAFRGLHGRQVLRDALPHDLLPRLDERGAVGGGAPSVANEQGMIEESALPDLTNETGAVGAAGTPEFQGWFGGSKVVDAEGAPQVVYHGTQRPDRIGDRFRASRATSGPMAFFTDNPDLASNYAKSKQDTSLEVPSYNEWFTMKPKGARNPVGLDRAWHHLSPEEQARVAELAPRVTWDDAAENIVLGPEGHTHGTGAYDQHLKESRGNHFNALVEEWLSSGNLFNQEERFKQVLDLAGVEPGKVSFDDPHATYPAVYPVHLNISKPLDTSDIPEDVMSALRTMAKRDRTRPAAGGADPWDKRTRDVRQWVEELERARTTGENSFVWTSIPDKVTETLRSLGYDGIKDTGGKMGGQAHTVWVPFSDKQIKSATGNSGKFSPSTSNITGQGAPSILAGTAGGIGGAAYGATQGDTPEERLRNAALYGLGGLAGGAGLGRFAEGAPLQGSARGLPDLGNQRGALGASGRVTDTPEFRRFFGDSKVVDDQGQPQVVYHGTQSDFSTFDGQRQGESVASNDIGFFFTKNPQHASDHASADWWRENPSPAVMPVYLSMQDPFRVENIGEPARWYDNYGSKAAKRAMADGHDGMIIGNGENDLYVVFNNKQIKSATGNRGTFDPTTANITMGLGALAAAGAAGSQLMPDDEERPLGGRAAQLLRPR